MHEAAALTVLAGAALTAFGLQAGLSVPSAAADTTSTSTSTSTSTTTLATTTSSSSTSSSTTAAACNRGNFVVSGNKVSITISGNCGTATNAYLAVYLPGAPSVSPTSFQSGTFPQTLLDYTVKPYDLPGAPGTTLTLSATLPDPGCYVQYDLYIGDYTPPLSVTSDNIFTEFPAPYGGTGYLNGYLATTGNQSCKTTSGSTTTTTITTGTTSPTTTGATTSTTISTSGSTGTTSSTTAVSTPPTTASTSPGSGGTTSTVLSSTTSVGTKGGSGTTSTTLAGATTTGSSSPPSTLASTGVDADALAGLGAFLILVGGGVFFAARRRPSQTQL
jgi:hypothetical protein